MNVLLNEGAWVEPGSKRLATLYGRWVRFPSEPNTERLRILHADPECDLLTKGVLNFRPIDVYTHPILGEYVINKGSGERSPLPKEHKCVK